MSRSVSTSALYCRPFPRPPPYPSAVPFILPLISSLPSPPYTFPIVPLLPSTATPASCPIASTTLAFIDLTNPDTNQLQGGMNEGKKGEEALIPAGYGGGEVGMGVGTKASAAEQSELPPSLFLPMAVSPLPTDRSVRSVASPYSTSIAPPPPVIKEAVTTLVSPPLGLEVLSVAAVHSPLPLLVSPPSPVKALVKSRDVSPPLASVPSLPLPTPPSAPSSLLKSTSSTKQKVTPVNMQWAQALLTQLDLSSESSSEEEGDEEQQEEEEEMKGEEEQGDRWEDRDLPSLLRGPTSSTPSFHDLMYVRDLRGRHYKAICAFFPSPHLRCSGKESREGRPRAVAILRHRRKELLILTSNVRNSSKVWRVLRPWIEALTARWEGMSEQEQAAHRQKNEEEAQRWAAIHSLTPSSDSDEDDDSDLSSTVDDEGEAVRSTVSADEPKARLPSSSSSTFVPASLLPLHLELQHLRPSHSMTDRRLLASPSDSNRLIFESDLTPSHIEAILHLFLEVEDSLNGGAEKKAGRWAMSVLSRLNFAFRKESVNEGKPLWEVDSD